MRKQVSINFIAQIIAFTLNVGISFFLTPYIVEKVGIEANGFVNLANNFIQYAQLLTIALNSMAGRFITIKFHQKDYKGAGTYFSSIILANIFLSIMLSIIFIFVIIFLNNILNITPNLLTDIQLLWTFIFLNFITSIFSSAYSVGNFIKNRLDLSALYNMEGYFIRVLVLFLTYFIFPSAVWYVGLATFIMGLYIMLRNIAFQKNNVPELKYKKENFNWKAIRLLLSSGIWNTISKLSSILSSGLDLLITNLFVNPIAMGILSVSKTLPTVILSLFGTMASTFMPELTINYAKNEIPQMKQQLIQSIKLFSFLSTILMSILFGFGKEFYALWTPTQDSNLLYSLTVVSCVELAFCLPLEPLYNVFIVTDKVKKSSVVLIVTSVITIVSVFIGLHFANTEEIKLFIIAGMSTLISTIRVLTFLPIYGAQCLNYKWTTFYPIIIKNVVSIFILTIFSFLLKQVILVNSWISLIGAILILVLLSIFINAFVLLNKRELRQGILFLKQKLGYLQSK